MNNLEKLDVCLMGEDVTKNFHKLYEEDKAFKQWLTEVLPEIELCVKQEQNNPWHIYNVIDHILHSVEEMNKQTSFLSQEERRVLAYTMFLHDIGKPACHIVRWKNGEKIDSFFNHNIEGAKVAKRVCPNFGFSEEESKIIEKLVYKHDIFMFIRNFDIPEEHKQHWRKLDDKLISEEIADLSQVGDGKKLLGFLIKVGRADSMAQNSKLTKPTLKLLDIMESMLDA